jgi:hypothetical protein
VTRLNMQGTHVVDTNASHSCSRQRNAEECCATSIHLPVLIDRIHYLTNACGPTASSKAALSTAAAVVVIACEAHSRAPPADEPVLLQHRRR